LKNGDYGVFNFDSGSEKGNNWSEPITYKAYTGADPIIEELYLNDVGDSYLVFDGLHFQGPDRAHSRVVQIYGASRYIKILNCEAEDREGWLDVNTNAVIQTTNDGLEIPQYITVYNCDVHTGRKGIGGSAENFVITNNHVHYISDSGIKVGGNGPLLIENNHIHNQDVTLRPPDPHGTALSIRSINTVIRNNTVHDYGNTAGLNFYNDGMPSGGYKNILVEKNLIYDPLSDVGYQIAIESDTISSNFTFRDNTLIGWIDPDWNNVGYKFRGTMILGLDGQTPYHSSYVDGEFKFYNNLFVTRLGAKSGLDDFQRMAEGNNIIWAIQGPASIFYDEFSPNSTSKILARESSMIHGDPPTYFEGSGNFFVGGDDFDTYSYTRGPGNGPHKQNLNDAYIPVVGSDACSNGIITHGHLTGEDCAPSGNYYYVRADATGANDGTSWIDAWQSFADMQADSKYLSDGLSGATLMVRKGGVSYGEFIEGGWWAGLGGFAPSPNRADWLVIKGENPNDKPVFNNIALGGTGRNTFIRFENIDVNFDKDLSANAGNKAIQTVGANKVHFDNLEIHSVWTDNIYGYPTETAPPDNSAYAYLSNIGVSLFTNTGDDPLGGIIINNSKIYNFHFGIDVNGNLGEFKIINSEIFNTTDSAIMMYGLLNKRNRPEILIENNHIHDQEPKYTGSDLSHGSGIVVMGDNYTIRNNKIHAFGSSYGVGMYSSVSNLLMENNLIYDHLNQYGSNLVKFAAIDEAGGQPGDLVILRNNTFIGFYSNPSSSNRDRYQYGSFSFGPISGDNTCAGLRFHDNIFVGDLYFRYSTNECTDYISGNNIYYTASEQTGEWTFEPYVIQGNNKNVFNEESFDYFENNFFDTARFDKDYADTRRYAGGEPHRENLNDYFRPVEGSAACSPSGIITHGHLAGEVCAEGTLPPQPCTPKTCSDYPGLCGSSLANGTCSGTLDCSNNCLSEPINNICDGTSCVECISGVDESNCDSGAGEVCSNNRCIVPGVVPNDYLAYWKFNGNMDDETGDYPGTCPGASCPTLTTDKNGNPDSAYDFDGTNDYINVGNLLASGSSELSITAWVLHEDTGDDRIICKSTGTAVADHVFSLGLTGTTVRARIDTGVTANYDASPYTVGQWEHVGLTYDGSNLDIYINGAVAASHPKSGDIIASNQETIIGNVNTADSRYFNGKIDNVMIYDRALTSQEIQQIYEAQS